MSIFNGKYVSVYEIINSAYRDSGMSNELNIADAIEWAGEAIEFIGGMNYFEEKVEVLLVNNHKVKIPCSLHIINGIKAKVDKNATEIEECLFDISSFSPMIYKSSIYHKYITNNDVTSTPNNLANNLTSKLTYNVNDNYIFTNFDKGFIALSYKGIVVDENGFPKIPDDVKVKNAVKYHLLWKLAFIKMLSGKISGQAYQIIERDRDWYIGGAQTRSVMPNNDQLESIKNNWIRLIPKINHHSDGFNSLNIQEQREVKNNIDNNSLRGQSNINMYTYKR